MNEKKLFNLASKMIGKAWPTDHLPIKDMLAYSISDSKFIAKDKSRAVHVPLVMTGCKAGFFRRDEADIKDIVTSTAFCARCITACESKLFQRSARGMADAIIWKLRGSGLRGICKFTLQVITAIERDPGQATGSLDLMVDGWKKAAASSVCEKYKRDVELGAVLTATPKYREALKHIKHTQLEPEVHLRDRITELSKGEYEKEWHNPDGLTIGEFLERYLPDPHSKEEIIKV